jgi:hypothetical protein
LSQKTIKLSHPKVSSKNNNYCSLLTRIFFSQEKILPWSSPLSSQQRCGPTIQVNKIAVVFAFTFQKWRINFHACAGLAVDNDVDSCSFTPRTSDQRWWQVGGWVQPRRFFKLGAVTFSSGECVLLYTILYLHSLLAGFFKFLWWFYAPLDHLRQLVLHWMPSAKTETCTAWYHASYSLLNSPHSSIGWFQSGGKLCLSDWSHGGEGEAVTTLTTRQILPTPIPPSKYRQNNYLPPFLFPLFFSSLVCDYGGAKAQVWVRPYLTRIVPGFLSIQIPRVVF